MIKLKNFVNGIVLLVHKFLEVESLPIYQTVQCLGFDSGGNIVRADNFTHFLKPAISSL